MLSVLGNPLWILPGSVLTSYIPARQSGHMQRLVIRIPSPGRHIEEWTYAENGKEDTVVPDVRRVKP